MTAAFGLSISAEAEVTHADPTTDTDPAELADQED